MPAWHDNNYWLLQIYIVGAFFSIGLRRRPVSTAVVSASIYNLIPPTYWKIILFLKWWMDILNYTTLHAVHFAVTLHFPQQLMYYIEFPLYTKPSGHRICVYMVGNFHLTRLSNSVSSIMGFCAMTALFSGVLCGSVFLNVFGLDMETGLFF